MLDAELPSTKNQVTFAVIKRLGFMLLIFSFMGSLFLYPTFGESSEETFREVSNSPGGVTGNQIKPYINEHFQQARWYSLIENIETQDNQITLRTYIFPDEEGRVVADEIVDDLFYQGIRGDILIYGRNVSYSLLTHRSSSTNSVIGAKKSR